MSSNVLATLAAAGILERTGRGRSTLRVSPRFLAHAEGTAGRLRLRLGHVGPRQSLETALRTWDEYGADSYPAAMFLERFLQDHNQQGQLGPMFPSLAQFVHPAAMVAS